MRESGVEGDLFEIKDYFAELIVLDDSKVIGKPITDIVLPESDINVISLKRGKVFVKGRQLKSLPLDVGDRLLVRCDSQNLQAFITEHKLFIKGDRPIPAEDPNNTEATADTELPKAEETLKPDDLENVF